MNEVGDILWVLKLDRPGLKIYRVTEHITKKSLKGTENSYLLENLQNYKDRPYLSDLDDENSIIVQSSDEAKDIMTKNAIEAIERLINTSVETIEKRWGNDGNGKSPIVELPSHSEKDDSKEFITLPDGSKAKANIKIPKELLGDKNVKSR